MRRAITGIDHVVIAVRDLDRAQESYTRLGFTLTPRGFHTLGSANHCIMFGSDYVELLALPLQHPAMRYYADFLARGEGLAAFALASANADAAHAELAADGIEADAPLDFSRPVRLAQGEREAAFRIVQLAPAQTPGCRSFVCQHRTRDLVWRPEYQTHAVGATGLAALAVVAEDPVGAAADYARLFASRPQKIDEGLLVQTGSAPIAVGSRWRIGRRLRGVELPPRARPLIAALFIRVADRGRAADALLRAGFEPAVLPDGSFAVGADRAHGVALVFG
ncbi:MAG TPA: VOC family protein [Burkholderiales bacterium]|nr:VOC family protein [Burkholderiales bacterium]